MEKFKDPAMLLSIANTVGMVGTTYYFYKQLEYLGSELGKVSYSLQDIIRRTGTLEKKDMEKVEAFKLLSTRINQVMEDLPDIDELDNLDMDITEIYEAMVEHEWQTERPSRRRSGDRKVVRRNEIEHSRKDVSSIRKPRRQTFETLDGRSRNDREKVDRFDRTDRSDRRDRSEQTRDRTDQTREDEIDLIREVRMQHGGS